MSGLRLGACVLLLGLLAACSGGGTREAVPANDVTANATMSPEIEPTTTPLPREIRGLFTDPRPSSPDLRRHVGPQSAATFDGWNHADVVLYDIERHTETNLGPGQFPVFTADGRYLVWASTAGVHVIEIATGVRRDLGVSGVPHALTRDRLWIQAPDRDYEVEIGTGDRRKLPGPPAERLVSLSQEAGRWRLTRVFSPRGTPEPLFDLVDLSGAFGTTRFEARSAVLAPDGRLFLATPPVQREDQGGAIRGTVGWSNLFEVDPATMASSFIASARASQALFPFSANERYVAWTEDFCNISNLESLAGVSSFPDSNGRTRIYDTQSGTLTELNQGFYIDGLTPRGELAIGAFGADALLNLETLEYTVVFPSDDRVWSPDYRYAAVGAPGGHGGYCGGE